jgi:HSP20 family molecular chaperone IbpA
MSLTRQFFNEMRPFFRLLEEPFIRPFAGHQHHLRRTALFDQPFFERPALDLSEQKDGYVVEAEVPGVKKEDLNIRIGDSGRSLTIEGRARYGAEAASHPAAEGEVVQSSDSQTSQGKPSRHFTSCQSQN